VGEDDTAEISRAIIKTHKYVLQNVAILTDRERGYMFNEYFPVVKKYLEPPQIVHLNTFDGFVKKDRPIKEKTLTDRFIFDRISGQPDTIKLSNLPSLIVGVRVAKDYQSYNTGNSWELFPVKDWTVNKLDGVMDFMSDINTPEIMDLLGAKKNYYIFVDYKGVKAQSYEVGEDGE
jgi:hypothetical protein